LAEKLPALVRLEDRDAESVGRHGSSIYPRAQPRQGAKGPGSAAANP
jgi:hypothetical protein